MNIQQYLQQRQTRQSLQTPPRAICQRCQQPQSVCYCHALEPFESNPVFLILIHPQETKKTVATGRMAHLTLKNSYFFKGKDFTHHAAVNELLQDPQYEPYLLFLRFDAIPVEEGLKKCSAGKTPLIVILDGTWNWAKSMFYLSENLQRLPRVKFTPSSKSEFYARKQPNEKCFSTIESIHHVITNFGEGTPQAERMLEPFRWMVKKQMEYSGRIRRK